MTPILFGRWQTRSFLSLFIGLPITLLFGIIIQNLITPLVILGFVYLQGLVMDMIYNLIQKQRWEQDWSPLLFTVTGIFEAVTLFVLIRMDYLPLVPADLPLHLFVIHYSTVWVAMFILAWGGMKIIFPWWRFRGGCLITK